MSKTFGQFTITDLTDKETYIRYANNDVGTGMQTSPNSSWSTTYMGILVTGDESIINDPTKYNNGQKWTKLTGDTGKGISSINVTYTTTTTNTLGSNPTWYSSITNIPVNKQFSATNKYLWSKQIINYTNGTSEPEQKGIISVYGDSGKDAITFRIYNIDGKYEFSDDRPSITLNTAAFKGPDAIQNASYIWYYWDEDLNQVDKYVQFSTSSSVTINSSDEYALDRIKCVMTYDNNPYEDYISLTKANDIYISEIEFLDGSNAITNEMQYIIAQISLYKNGQEVDEAPSKSCWGGTNSVSGTTITTDYTNDDNLSAVYFVIPQDDSYDLVLGVYKNNSWQVQQENHDYTYVNTYDNSNNKTLIIPKSKINKNFELAFNVYKNGDRISGTSATIFDLNDPIISSTDPVDNGQVIKDGQLWVDTSDVNPVIKTYSDGEWLETNKLSGNTIYSEYPKSYNVGDLWIISESDYQTYKNNIESIAQRISLSIGPGSMLKANTLQIGAQDTPLASHWDDAMADSTKMMNNITQYFEFDGTDGLIIGDKQANNDGKKFYVNINSQEMGFYEKANDNVEHKMVSISNKMATIQNLRLEGELDTHIKNDAIFHYDATFEQNLIMGSAVDSTFGFVWQVESDGSLSLVTK